MKTEKVKHTPGPWTVSEGNSILSTLDGEQVQIAIMSRTSWMGNLSQREFDLSAKFRSFKDEDARLIAEAPAMYEALKSLLATIEGAMLEDDPQAATQMEWTAWDDVRQLISRIEGGQSE